VNFKAKSCKPSAPFNAATKVARQSNVFEYRSEDKISRLEREEPFWRQFGWLGELLLELLKLLLEFSLGRAEADSAIGGRSLTFNVCWRHPPMKFIA
jgi:hypothetical protein